MDLFLDCKILFCGNSSDCKGHVMESFLLKKCLLKI